MGHWITLTAVLIMQAYPSATWQRALERMIGTLFGGVIAVGATLFLHGPTEVLLVIVPMSLLAMGLLSVNYALYVLWITPMFILITELFNRCGVLTPDLAGVRMLDSGIGVLVGALATFVLWPSWEGRFLRRRLADDIRDSGRFVLAALDALTAEIDHQQLEIARRKAALSGNNADASLRRILEEPRRYPQSDIAAAMAITSASRRLGGLAAAIALVEVSPQVHPELAMARRSLQRAIDDLADALKHARTPVSIAPEMITAQSEDPIGDLVARASRQLRVARDSAATLAREPIKPATAD